MTSISYNTLDAETDQIRLLTILPSGLGSLEISSHDSTRDRKERLNCTIETVSLNRNPTYQALSYQWDPSNAPKVKQEILVNGVPVEIGSNLESALHQIRQVEKPVRIWVDAICINQQDEVEKGSQVRLMKSIYEKATSALVWLGPALDDSDMAMKFLNRVGQTTRQAGILRLARRADMAIWNQPGPNDPFLSLRTATDDLSNRTGLDLPYTALKLLSEREYWSRVWIVQEFVVPGKLEILCGSEQVSFESFAAGTMFLGFHRTRMHKNITALDIINSSALQDFLSSSMNGTYSVLNGLRRRYQSKEVGSGINLITLMTKGCIVATSSLSCRYASRRRDKIFGLLALAEDQPALGIKPDYRQTIQEVYTHATRALIENNHLVLLSWCQLPKAVPELPSWVPDFSIPIRDPCCDSTDQKLFSASGARSLTIFPTVGHGSNILAIQGTIVDTISIVGSHWQPGLDSNFKYEAATTLFAEIKRFCAHSWRIDPSKWSDTKVMADAIWKIPCAEQDATRIPRTRVTAAALQGYCELSNFLDLMPTTSGALLQSYACQPYKMAMEYLHNRRPLLSAKGYVGLVPAHAVAGDVVCILYGSSVPFVLRGLDSGNYELVGEAYVFGIMDGEFLENDPPSKDFYIC